MSSILKSAPIEKDVVLAVVVVVVVDGDVCLVVVDVLPVVIVAIVWVHEGRKGI
jgi:hypothetical protein